jgi:hypothetical protein
VLWLDRSTVNGRGLYPAGETTLNVRYRSVFTDTKWTVRPLDILELGGLYDVPKARRYWLGCSNIGARVHHPRETSLPLTSA